MGALTLFSLPLTFSPDANTPRSHGWRVAHLQLHSMAKWCRSSWPTSERPSQKWRWLNGGERPPSYSIPDLDTSTLPNLTHHHSLTPECASARLLFRTQPLVGSTLRAARLTVHVHGLPASSCIKGTSRLEM